MHNELTELGEDIRHIRRIMSYLAGKAFHIGGFIG